MAAFILRRIGWAVFLFLVTTFYLLMDAPRIKNSIREVIPEPFRDELVALGMQINVTWQQYIRGELVLFAIMATATTVGLMILQVPGALILGLVSGDHLSSPGQLRLVP